jgi:hypothetical protein
MVEVEEEPRAICRRCSLAALGVVVESLNEMSWTKLENDMIIQRNLDVVVEVIVDIRPRMVD